MDTRVPPSHGAWEGSSAFWIPGFRPHTEPRVRFPAGEAAQPFGFPGWCGGKESTCRCVSHKRCGFNPWVGKIHWRRKWHPTPAFLPRKSHGQRSLAGCSQRGPRELGRTGHTHSKEQRMGDALEKSTNQPTKVSTC